MRNIFLWLGFLLLLAVPTFTSYRLADRAYHAEVDRQQMEEDRRRVAAAKEITAELQLAMKSASDLLGARLEADLTFEQMRATVDGNRIPMADTFTLLAEPWPGAPVSRRDYFTRSVSVVQPGEAYSHSSGENIVYEARLGKTATPDRAGYEWSEASILRDGNALLAPQGFALRRHPQERKPVSFKDSFKEPMRMLQGWDVGGEPGMVIANPKLGFDVVAVDPAAVDSSIRRVARMELRERMSWILGLDAAMVFFFWRSRRNKRLADLRTDFVASVSHELRTPLASVRMFSELLEAKAIPADERAEVEHTLANEARRLHMTLERMLRFGALSRGRLDAERKIQPLQPILLAAAARSGPHVAVSCDAALEASVDDGLLGNALDNLLGNAAKYAPGPVSLRAALVDGSIVVDVTDRGPGIARRAQRRIFQPFERADDRLSKATQGTGVGLALVRGIAKAHGGSATVASEPGTGATFTLRFPQIS